MGIRAGQAQPAAVAREGCGKGRAGGRRLVHRNQVATWPAVLEARPGGGPASAAGADPRRPGVAGGQGPGGAREACGEVRTAGPGLVHRNGDHRSSRYTGTRCRGGELAGSGNLVARRAVFLFLVKGGLGAARADPRRPGAAGGRGPDGAREACGKGRAGGWDYPQLTGYPIPGRGMGGIRELGLAVMPVITNIRYAEE